MMESSSRKDVYLRRALRVSPELHQSSLQHDTFWNQPGKGNWIMYSQSLPACVCLCFFFFLTNLYILIGGNYFAILWWFLPYTDMNQPWVYMSHPDTPSHLPSHPILQGYLSAPALSTLPHASNLDWRQVSHMIIYIFQSYSLKSADPCLLPESNSLFFSSVSLLLSRIQGHCYHLSKFHIYALIYCNGVFLSDLIHSV